MTCRQLGRGFKCRLGVADLVMALEAILEPAQDLHGIGDARLGYVDLLEPPRQCAILLEHAAEFLIGRRTHAPQLARRQLGLEQVRCVHHAARGRAGANDGVNLVDKQYSAVLLAELGEHALEALFEIAAIFRTGDQRPEIERIDHAMAEHVGDFTVDDHARQAFGDRRLADPRLAHEQRVVLAAPAERLNDPLDLVIAPDERIHVALGGLAVEIGRVLFERRLARLAFFAGLFGRRTDFRTVGFRLRHAVRHEIDHIQARHILFAEQVHGVGLLFGEDGDQHVDRGDLLLARRLHVIDRALQHALKPQRGLNLVVFACRDDRHMRIDIAFELAFETGNIGIDRFEHLDHRRVIQQ